MLSSLQTTWNGLSTVQRTLLISVMTAVLGGILLVTWMAGRPSYGVLFSKLEAEDAGAITTKLKELKVDYHLTSGGTTIEVPTDKVYDLRLSLASEGLPKGGAIGFELFDKNQFGASDFTQHLNYQRALQGELERTISQLDGVTAARVHLALPQKRVFTDQQDPTTASVVVHLRPSYEMPEPQVGGIVHLVSSAVEGLKPSDVSVHDAQGELLSTEANGSMLSGTQVEMQERYERRMEGELTRLAEQVLGAGKAAIRVSTELDWDQTETTSETYRGAGRGGKGITLDEQTATESYTRPDANAEGGLPGTATNLNQDGTTSATTTNQVGAYNSSRITNKYAVNKVVERKVSAPGQVRRVSVAVLLDGKISLPKQRALKDAFAAAAGLDLAPDGRGDKIELLQMDFDRTADDEETRAIAAASKQEFQTALVRNGAAVAVVALLVGGTLLLLRKPKAKAAKAPKAQPELTPTPQLDAMVGEERLTPADALAETAMAHEEPAPLGLDGPLTSAQKPVSLEVIRKLADEQPEEVARQLQVWMME